MSSQRILMVCLGNICRSPLAEGILREKARAAGLDWEIDSAGTNSYHTGQAPHPLSLKVARDNGIDISTQIARRFTAADFQRFDKIYAMAGDVIDDMRRIAGRQGLRLSPLGSTSSVPFAVLGYPAKVDLLMNEVHPGSNEDVPDPYYGPEPGYHDVYAMIDEAADHIIAKYGQPNPSNQPSPSTQPTRQ
jgi:protein-tyrosine phosphatase